ncbi:hypothetical protein PF003_g1689 [Phytophthora fragariae]|nr:hypothetical protein PF003_g1689 [Phytophthora fragariae]
MGGALTTTCSGRSVYAWGGQSQLVETSAAPTSISVTTAARVAAGDGLPTATMEVDGEQWPINLDSGARYSVAGTDWRLRGERLQEAAPVDFVKGIGGFGLDVIGVWSFQMRNVFGQIMEIRHALLMGVPRNSWSALTSW